MPPRRRPTGGRTTPKGTRPRGQHLSLLGGEDLPPDPIDDFLESARKDFTEVSGPIDALTWASAMMGMFDHVRSLVAAQHPGEETPPFELLVLDRCLQRGGLLALQIATAFAAVAREPLATVAVEIAGELRQRLGVTLPWSEAASNACLGRGVANADPFGDQASVMIEVEIPGHRSCTLVALVDNGRGGQLKDVFLSADPIERLVEFGRRVPDGAALRSSKLAPDEAAATLAAALRAAEAHPEDDDWREQDDVGELRALLWKLLERAGEGPAVDSVNVAAPAPVRADRADDNVDTIETLVAEFVASPEALQCAIPATELRSVARRVLARRHPSDDLRRWSPSVVIGALLDGDEELDLPTTKAAVVFERALEAFVRFCDRTRNQAPELTSQTVNCLRQVCRELIDEAADDGADLAVVGAGSTVRIRELHSAAPSPKQAAPSRPPAGAELQEAMRDTTAMRRLEQLATFYGDGRKLTQTGNPTLADAKALVSSLGTDDRIDEVIGDRTFRTTSANELPELQFFLRWAVAAGALRKQHGKLLGTAGWRKPVKDPSTHFRRVVDALVRIGPLDARYAPGPRYGPPPAMIDDAGPALLEELAAEPWGFEDLVLRVEAEYEDRYQWPTSGYWADPDHRRSSGTRMLQEWIQIYDWSGILTWAGWVDEPHPVLAGHHLRRGGDVALTPLGAWIVATA